MKGFLVTILALVLVSVGTEASRDSIRQQLLLREDLSTESKSKDTQSPTTPTRTPTTPTRLPTGGVVIPASTTNAPTPLPSNGTFNNGNSTNNITIVTWASFEELPRWGQIVLCVLVIIFGLINTYAGYRYFRFSVFVIGGFVVFLVMLGVLETAVSNENPDKAAIVWGVAAASWVVAGLILVACIPVGIFLMGAAIGVVIALVLNPIALRYVWPENPQGNLYLWMAIFGIVTGLITICFERPILIVSTALTGSILVILGIGGIAGNLVLAIDESNVPWTTWAYIGGFLALAASGLLAQICYTAVDRDHKDKGNNGYYTPLNG